MTYAEFQDRWDVEAQRELDGYLEMSPFDLLQQVESRNYGSYHTLWTAVARICRLDDVRDTLMRILRSDEEYLTRYHCAGALIALSSAAEAGFTEVQLSARGLHNVDARLDDLETFLNSRAR